MTMNHYNTMLEDELTDRLDNEMNQEDRMNIVHEFISELDEMSSMLCNDDDYYEGWVEGGESL